jgi:hypothetical protein
MSNEQVEQTAVPFILDASILDEVEVHEVMRDDVKRNRIQYIFPAGLNQLDLLEECRALNKLDDFDLMYDITMQALAGKPVTIVSVCDDGARQELCSFQVTDRYMNLRGIDVIDAFPCLVSWLTEMIGAHLSKKYPTPSKSALSLKGSKNNKDSRTETTKPLVK